MVIISLNIFEVFTFPICSVSKITFAVIIEGPLQLVSVSHKEKDASENKAWGPVPGTYEICDGNPKRKDRYTKSLYLKAAIEIYVLNVCVYWCSCFITCPSSAACLLYFNCYQQWFRFVPPTILGHHG